MLVPVGGAPGSQHTDPGPCLSTAEPRVSSTCRLGRHSPQGAILSPGDGLQGAAPYGKASGPPGRATKTSTNILMEFSHRAPRFLALPRK